MSYEFYIVTFIHFVQNGTKKVRFQLELKYLVLEIWSADINAQEVNKVLFSCNICKVFWISSR